MSNFVTFQGGDYPVQISNRLVTSSQLVAAQQVVGSLALTPIPAAGSYIRPLRVTLGAVPQVIGAAGSTAYSLQAAGRVTLCLGGSGTANNQALITNPVLTMTAAQASADTASGIYGALIAAANTSAAGSLICDGVVVSSGTLASGSGASTAAAVAGSFYSGKPVSLLFATGASTSFSGGNNINLWSSVTYQVVPCPSV